MYNIVDSSVLQRVFMMAVRDDCTGTCFIIEKDKRYLVTAKHLFEKANYPKQTKVYIMQGNKWVSIDNKVYYHTSDTIDIAVIETNYFDNIDFEPVYYTYKESLFSQDVFMLGFPYGNESGFYEANRNFPIPYIKKGILSGKRGETLIIDWDNNHGFSGGPVVYRKYENGDFSERMYIAGVTSGYLQHEIEVVANDAVGKIIGSANENSGMGVMYPIEYAIEIIESIK